jgi:uncharacterized membrane protein YccF (DUF307 family)
MYTWQRVVWIVTLGPLFALPWLVFGTFAAVTVVALPWAKSAYRVALWIAWPTNEVPTSGVEHNSNLPDPSHPTSAAGYLVWLAVAGLWLSVLHHVIAALFGLSIVGIIALFPHLELGRMALVLNPATFRMASRGWGAAPQWGRSEGATGASHEAPLNFP